MHICLQQFITTIHAIKTFVKLIVSTRYVCIAYHSFPLHSVFIKKEFFLSFRWLHIFEDSPSLKHTSLIIVVKTCTNLAVMVNSLHGLAWLIVLLKRPFYFTTFFGSPMLNNKLCSCQKAKERKSMLKLNHNFKNILLWNLKKYRECTTQFMNISQSTLVHLFTNRAFHMPHL